MCVPLFYSRKVSRWSIFEDRLVFIIQYTPSASIQGTRSKSLERSVTRTVRSSHPPTQTKTRSYTTPLINTHLIRRSSHIAHFFSTFLIFFCFYFVFLNTLCLLNRLQSPQDWARQSKVFRTILALSKANPPSCPIPTRNKIPASGKSVLVSKRVLDCGLLRHSSAHSELQCLLPGFSSSFPFNRPFTPKRF